MQNNENVLSRREKIIGWVLALSIPSIINSYGLSRSALEDHEAYVAVTAREMIANNNWLFPTFNGQLRLQKGPLCYWLVAGFSKLTGEIDEFTSRLPSVVFGTLSVAIILIFAGRHLGFRAGFLSALIWSTMLGFIRYSDSARPEMAFTFFVMLALLSFYRCLNTESRKEQIICALIFWVSFGMGNLAKGPAALIIIGMPVLVYFTVFSKWRTAAKIMPVVGMVIFLTISLTWPLIVTLNTPQGLAVWKQEAMERVVSSYISEDNSILYYVRVTFVMMIPWVAFVPMTMLSPFYKVWGLKQSFMFFLLIWFLTDTSLMILFAGNRQHYIIPALPAMAILAGVIMEDMIFEQRAYSRKFTKGFLQWHLVVIITLAAGWPICARFILPGTSIVQAITLSAVVTVILAVVLFLFYTGRTRIACIIMLAGLSVSAAIVRVYTVSPVNTREYFTGFLNSVSQKLPPSVELTVFGNISGKFVYYFGRPIPIVKDVPKAEEIYNKGGWILAFDEYLKKFSESGQFVKAGEWEVSEHADEKPVRAALIHKP